VATHEGFLKIGSEPDPTLHVFSTEKVLSLLDKLIGTHLDVLIEEVATEDLLSVTIVEDVRGHEEKSKSSLGHELHVLVVEEDVIVVQEQALYHDNI